MERFQYFRWCMKFSLGGISIIDKYKSLGFALAMRHPFVTNSLLDSMLRFFFGTSVTLSHSYMKGKKITIRFDDSSHMLIAREFFVLNVYDLSLVPFEPDYILDFGAHIGLFSIQARARYSKSTILAFEPLAENYEFLKLQKNNNDESNFEIIKKAISTTDGKAYFYSNEGKMGRLEIDDDDIYEKLEVETESIFNYLQFDQKLLMKMDIEGGERNIFPEVISKLPLTCFVYLETHDGIDALLPIKEEFNKYNFTFKITRIRDRYIDCFAFR